MAMQIVLLLIVSTFLLQKRCSAKELHCTVEELDDDRTKYTIPKDNATDCICYWTDPKGVVLENHDSVNETEGQSEWKFASEVCHNQLHFSCTCLSETEQNTASCTADCSRKESVGDQQEMKNAPTKSANDNVTPRHHSMLMGSGILFVLVTLLLLLAFCYRDHNQVHF